MRGAVAPKELMTYAGLRLEHWSWNLCHEAEVEPSGLDWSLLDGDGASWQRSQPRGWNWSQEAGLEVICWDWGLKAGIDASKLELEP